MATIKSYTNIEQSKKLAEILPLESADMHYNNASIKGINYVDEYIANLMDYNNAIIVLSKYTINPLFKVIPCWSLAALLAEIPYNVSFNRAVYRFELVKFPDYWECYHENFGCVSTEIFKADNPVDACYEMILKLKELNLL